jgi:hypothetical protein
VPLNDALLIVFRFLVLDIIDYWSSNVLSLPGAENGGSEMATASSSTSAEPTSGASTPSEAYFASAISPAVASSSGRHSGG